MKRNNMLTVFAILAVVMLTLTSCGRSVFKADVNSDKLITITAENADKGDYVMTGSLAVTDGEQIEITSNLSKGMIRVEVVRAPENQNIEKIPEIKDEAIITADVSNTDRASGTVPAGSYMVKAACIEKAVGTVLIEVKPAA